MTDVRFLGNVYNEKWTGGNYGGSVFDPAGIAPALTTMEGGDGNQ